MKKDFLCTLITPKGTLFDAPALSVQAHGIKGRFGVLPGHQAMVARLIQGALRIVSANDEKFFAVSSGTLEVGDQHNVLILVDDAIPCASQDELKKTLLTIRA